jgi:hypothetical protein
VNDILELLDSEIVIVSLIALLNANTFEFTSDKVTPSDNDNLNCSEFELESNNNIESLIDKLNDATSDIESDRVILSTIDNIYDTVSEELSDSVILSDKFLDKTDPPLDESSQK